MNHAGGEPSPWVQRFAHLLPPGASVLDLACGSGRHMRWLAAQGFVVTGVDRDAAALAGLAAVGRTLLADLEGPEWPLAGQRFDGVVVTHYLWRPRWPELLDCLAPGGLLIYETFADGQGEVGKPSSPNFLLQSGELLQRCAGLRVVAFEDGFETAPERFVQRIAAVRTGGCKPAGQPGAPRYRLDGGGALTGR